MNSSPPSFCRMAGQIGLQPHFNARPKLDGKLFLHLNEYIMKLGAFSISLSVKDIKASKNFYESLGFKAYAGDIEKKYLIMKNESSIIGLFQGMFENNILTFNPGWDEFANKLESFDDIREIQRQLKKQGIKLESEADENTTGPASIVILDPDGNPVLIDQHV